MSDDIERLRKELYDLKYQFNKRITDIEQKILLAESRASAKYNENSVPARQAGHARSHFVAESETTRKADVTPTNRQQTPPPTKPPGRPGAPSGTNEDSPWANTPKHFPEFSLKRALGNLEPLLGPLAGVIKGAFDTYQHYRREGKAPVFLLTVAGIIALVLGFGYLLQYSLNNWLNELAKVGLGFITSCGIIYAGIWINKNKKDFSEYAAALMGLGVILNYLCIYFVGPYYGLLNPGTGFVLLVINTGAAYALASIFETRVVAVITLLGGATTPLLLDAPDSDPLVYAYYLCFLAVAVLHLAEKIAWKRLTQATWVVIAAMVELSLHQTSAQPGILSLGIPFILFYLFSYFILFSGKRLRTSVGLEDLILVSANIAFFIYSLYTVNPSLSALGMQYLGSAITFFVGYAIFQDSSNKKISGLLVLTGGILLGFAILALSNVYVIGLFWAVEALCLVYFGFKFQFREVRLEGYFVLLIAIAQIVNLVFNWWVNATTPHLDFAWGNLLSLGAILLGTYMILDHYKPDLLDYEKWINYGCKELYSFWLVTIYIITTVILIPDYVLVLSLIPMTYLLFRYAKWDLQITQYLALAHLLFLVLQMVIGAIEAGSFRFTQQPLLAKIARLEFAACMWLLFEFYVRFKPTSKVYTVAKALRIVLYMLIPIVFIPYIIRNYPQWLPVALWGSTTICYLLSKNLQYTILRKELRVLAIATSVVTIAACFLAYEGLWTVRALEALALGNILYISLLIYEKGLIKATYKQAPNKLLFSAFFYYLGASIYIISYIVIKDYEISLLISASYFYFLILKLPIYVPLRNNLAISYITGTLLALLMVLTYISTNLYFDIRATVLSMFAALIIGYMIHNKQYAVKTVIKKLGGESLHLWGFHVLLAITYSAILGKLFSDWETPAISVAFVIHATTVLFLTLKPRFIHLSKLMLIVYGLALFKIFFVDLSESSLIEKVIAFLLIGVLLLVGAYQFQKYRSASMNNTVAGT